MEALKQEQLKQARPAETVQPLPNLNGRVALITGGARGLGEALCRSLGEAGARVVSVDVLETQARAGADKLTAQGIEAAAFGADITDSAQVERVMQQVLERFGRLDIVVNNAGVDRTVSIEEMAVGDWERIVAVNLTAPFIVSKLALPIMRQQGSGHIVNIVSTAAKRCWANASAYHASKYGLLGLSHAMHVEARPHNVKVTAVISGGLRTPFLLERFPDIDLNVLQDPKNVADTVRYVLTQPGDCVIPEIMVLPMRETSWP